MKISRKFNRDSLRKEVGNGNLKFVWERFQQEKYGQWYQRICFKRGKQKNQKFVDLDLR